MEYQDYYKTLGVEKSASADAIKKAYRKLAKKYHPDLHPDDEKAQDQFKKINEAYEVLGDEEKRKKYDLFGAQGNFSGGQNFDPRDFGYQGFGSGRTVNMGGSGFSDFFDLIFGGLGNRSGFNRGQQAGGPEMGGFKNFGGFQGFGDGQGFSGFGNVQGFGGFGGPGGPGRRAQSAAVQDRYETTLDVPIAEAFRGGKRSMHLRLGDKALEIPVQWPAGIQDGNKIRIKGEKFGFEGNLMVKIHIVTPDRLEGLHLVKKITLTPWEAYFGLKKQVETLDGKINVKIPKKMTMGKQIRVPGKGYKNRKEERGDLLLEIQIENPTVLTKEQEKLYAELRDLEKAVR